MLAYPLRAGWLDADNIQLVPGLTARAVRESGNVALLDALAARTLLDTHVVVRDLAIASRRASFIIFATHTRPDDVGSVTISTAGVSPAALALAQIVIPDFYGVPAQGWTDAGIAAERERRTGQRRRTGADPFRARGVVSGGSRPRLAGADRQPVCQPRVCRAALGRRHQPGRRRRRRRAPRAARALGQSTGARIAARCVECARVDREVLTETLADQTWELGKDELQRPDDALAPRGTAGRGQRIARRAGDDAPVATRLAPRQR